MSRLSRIPNIHSVYVADGFVEDCEDLVQRCLQVKTLSYQKFCNIWKEMNMASVFFGKTTGAELAEFSEEVLYIAKKCMFAKTSNFEETVIGVFLVYALLNLQPYAGFAALKLIQEDVDTFERIALVARRTRRFDVLYILGAILIRGPCQFHVTQRERGFELQLRKYFDGELSMDEVDIGPRGVFSRHCEELHLIKELKGLSQLYDDSKRIGIEKSERDLDLKYVDQNLSEEIGCMLRKVMIGVKDFQEDTDSENEGTAGESRPERGSTVLYDIKQKALQSKVANMKHLAGIEERGSKISKIVEPEENLPDEQNMTSEDRSTTSDRKCCKKRRKPTPRLNLHYGRKRKTRQRVPSDEEETSDDLVELVETQDKNENVILVDELDDASATQEVNVDFDFLPDVISSTPQDVVIEFIDNLNKPEDNYNPEIENFVKESVFDDDDAEIIPFKGFQETTLQERGKPSTRPHIYKKYKRMGMLSVANFSDPDDPFLDPRPSNSK